MFCIRALNNIMNDLIKTSVGLFHLQKIEGMKLKTAKKLARCQHKAVRMAMKIYLNIYIIITRYMI